MVSVTDGSEPAATHDGFQQMVRLPPMADGERPAATSDERFRPRASDGSQPLSRMEMTDGERPAVMVTDGERPAAMMSVDATKKTALFCSRAGGTRR